MLKNIYLMLPLLVFAGCLNIPAVSQESTALKLKKSPRLWVPKDTALNLSKKLHTADLKARAKRVIEDADWLVDLKPIAEGEAWSYQHGTRTIASHLQCLTAAWALTRKAKYRKAAIRHLANIMNWKQISCEANPYIPEERVMMFCLSYGEHCADIALMYDFFRADITPEEKKVFNDVLDKFYLKAALNCVRHPPWWANKQWSNWNGVCAGGMGMMALAFYEDRPECRKLIPFVEKSLGEYFKSYITNGGGNHEGTGYWNYGMHYAIRYLLSWENATGKKHSAFKIKELQKTFDFPLDFHGITFGDNDGWHPTGMFFLACRRLDNSDAALRAATYLNAQWKPRTKKRQRLSRVANGDNLYAAGAISTTEVMEKFRKKHEAKKEPIARVYEGLGWAALADDSAFPRLRLSARGGSNKIAGHGMLDLLSFKCMVNGQRMIEDQTDRNRVAFTSRGHHLYGRSAASKSTIFVDGLGSRENAVCPKTEVVQGDKLIGIRVDGTGTFLSMWRRHFIGRLFLMVEGRYWLVISSAPGHSLESRFHTFAEHKSGADWVQLKRGNEEMMMTFAAIGKGFMQQSKGTPASPRKQTQIYRWMTHRGDLHVTAMNPGSKKLGLKLSREKDGGHTITISGADKYRREIKVTKRLELGK